MYKKTLSASLLFLAVLSTWSLPSDVLGIDEVAASKICEALTTTRLAVKNAKDAKKHLIPSSVLNPRFNNTNITTCTASVCATGAIFARLTEYDAAGKIIAKRVRNCPDRNWEAVDLVPPTKAFKAI